MEVVFFGLGARPLFAGKHSQRFFRSCSVAPSASVAQKNWQSPIPIFLFLVAMQSGGTHVDNSSAPCMPNSRRDFFAPRVGERGVVYACRGCELRHTTSTRSIDVVVLSSFAPHAPAQVPAQNREILCTCTTGLSWLPRFSHFHDGRGAGGNSRTSALVSNILLRRCCCHPLQH